MSEVEWRGRLVPVKIDKARIFLLGLPDNEAAIAQVSIIVFFCVVRLLKSWLMTFFTDLFCPVLSTLQYKHDVTI